MNEGKHSAMNSLLLFFMKPLQVVPGFKYVAGTTSVILLYWDVSHLGSMFNLIINLVLIS